MKYLVRFWLFALFSPLVTQMAQAHPHSFVDLNTTFLTEQKQLTALKMAWTLDEIASSDLIYELNHSPDKNQKYKDLRDEMAQTAVDNHYFSYLYDNQNQPIKFTSKPTEVAFEVENNRIIFKMMVHLAKPQPLTPALTLMTYEPSYYIGMEYNQPHDLAINDATCRVALVQPQVDSKLQSYAASLDKTESPDEDMTLGRFFAQKVTAQCD